MPRTTSTRKPAVRKTAAARKSPAVQAAPKTAAAKPADLHALLVAELGKRGIVARVKWSPTRKYASYVVDGRNVGYVFAQTRNGVRVEPAAAVADLKTAA